MFSVKILIFLHYWFENKLFGMKFEYKITLIYLILGLLWIIFSDRILSGMITDPELLSFFQSIKGSFYILLTSVLLFVLVRRNIQKHRLFEEKLKEREAVLRSVIENIPFDFWARDCQQVCFLQNERSKKFWGDLIGTKPADIDIKKETLKVWKDNNKRALNGEIINEEISVPDKFGVERIFQNVVAPVINENRVTSILGLNIEITEQKKAEKELTRAKERAEESDRLKSAFLANMSHEIRTPMNGILGFVRLLESTDLHSDEKEMYIDFIKQSSERLLNTINDIIEISKIESGQVLLHYKSVKLREFMDFLYGFFKPEAINKNLEFVLSNSECVHLAIHTDENKLQSVLTNLLKNALKFTKTGKIEFGCTLSGSLLTFFVKDTGAGIPKNKLNAIFQRFVQADISTTKPYEGSGLGLSIALEYSRMLNGNIRVESEEGKGSTFWFEMPYKETEVG